MKTTTILADLFAATAMAAPSIQSKHNATAACAKRLESDPALLNALKDASATVADICAVAAPTSSTIPPAPANSLPTVFTSHQPSMSSCGTSRALTVARSSTNFSSKLLHCIRVPLKRLPRNYHQHTPKISRPNPELALTMSESNPHFKMDFWLKHVEALEACSICLEPFGGEHIALRCTGKVA